METPDTSHLNPSVWNSVYEPAEDTFLLLDALEQDLAGIMSLRPTLAIEVGSGSGIVGTAMAKSLGSTCVVMATDLNPDACQVTSSTAVANGVRVECIRTDLVSGMDRLEGKVDLLVCNPPYVTTLEDEVGGKGLQAAWAGGPKGRIVLDRLLERLPRVLSQKGLAYLLLSKENDIDDVRCVLENKGFSTKVVVERKAGAERLLVLRASREGNIMHVCGK